MCGFAGILRFSEDVSVPDLQTSQKVLQSLKHRGPDSEGSIEIGKLHLYHSRLSILDTSDASSQPYRYAEHNDALVYNGEIFNYLELAQNIAGLRTSGDVEVLYRLLRKRGAKALTTLNGFFAFAYANEKGDLLLARDRFGVKPLYYFYDQKKLVFASELKPLLELTGPRRLNARMIYTYFRLNYCAGNETIFEGVYRLAPGQLLRLSDGRIQTEQWYSVPETSAKQDLYSLLDDAVRLRLRSDVPAGAFLSGGLDSSIIAALAKKHKADLQTFCVSFREQKYLDESEDARIVADHIGSDHTEINLKADDFLSNIDAFLDTVDEPFADSSAFNMFMLCKHARSKIKVALSGDGADELFKGYRKHRALLLSEKPGSGILASAIASFLPGKYKARGDKEGDRRRKADKFAELTRLPVHERQKFLASISSHAAATSLIQPAVSSIYFDSLFGRNELLPAFGEEEQFDLLHVLADDMLVKTDRFSMRAGLEVRCPFLDYRIVEHALNLPRKEKLTARQQKIVLRKTFGHLLPLHTLKRNKKGFEIPLESWLKNQLHDRVKNEWLNEDRILHDGLLNPAGVKEIKQKLFSSSPDDSAARTWAIIVFNHWLHNYRHYISN